MLTLKEFIDFYCTEKRKKNLFYGFTLFGLHKIERDIPRSFTLQNDWCYGRYRKVWTSDKEKAFITYCEGDIYVQLFQTEEQYKKSLDEAHQFYTRF